MLSLALDLIALCTVQYDRKWHLHCSRTDQVFFVFKIFSARIENHLISKLQYLRWQSESYVFPFDPHTSNMFCAASQSFGQNRENICGIRGSWRPLWCTATCVYMRGSDAKLNSLITRSLSFWSLTRKWIEKDGTTAFEYRTWLIIPHVAQRGGDDSWESRLKLNWTYNYLELNEDHDLYIKVTINYMDNASSTHKQVK